MYKRYFVKRNPDCCKKDIEWKELSGEEFYRFIHCSENQDRHFIDMDDVVLECTESEYRSYKAQKNHSSYVKAQQKGWRTVSIYAYETEHGCCGEDIIADPSQNVEETAIRNLHIQALRESLSLLPEDARWLIDSLYLAETPKTLRELSMESGIPVMTLQNRKAKILAQLGGQLSAKKNFSKKQK